MKSHTGNKIEWLYVRKMGWEITEFDKIMIKISIQAVGKREGWAGEEKGQRKIKGHVRY